MQAKKKRLTLDMDPEFQRRLKVTAALKGVSMRQYCLGAIGKELDRDQSNDGEETASKTPVADRFRESRRKMFGDRVFPGNSADLILEAREERTAQLEAAITGKKQSGRFGVGELIALRDEIFGDRVLPGNSADLLREASDICAS